ncbi:hypothetical protein SUGI_0133880 [Cryptomeria japonica]|nr:hypothetical protein SUGI_0133880 [Cryptomeria japonica]
MEEIISCMESFQLLRTLSFTARAGFAREGYVHMALFFSALAFCFWAFVLGWWKKHVQSVFTLSLSPCFSFKFNPRMLEISRVPAMMFAPDQVSHINNPTVYCEGRCTNTGTSMPAEENESESRGKFYMRFECSLQSPEEQPAHDIFQNREEGIADCKSSDPSFSSSSAKQIFGLGNFRNYEEAGLESPNRDLLKLLLLPEYIVKCSDVSWSRELLAASTVDSINTVRLWDIPASRCLNYMKFEDPTVIAGARFSNSPHLHLLSGIGISGEKSSLYVWDTRNFMKPLSFSLGKNSNFYIVEFIDKKAYVCDDLSEKMFDLRMAGAPVLEICPGVQRRDALTSSCLMDKETRAQLRNSCNLHDFGLYTSSLLQKLVRLL